MRLDPRTITRADLPAQFTPETLRQLPIPVLKYVADPKSGVLNDAELKQFDAAMHELMELARQRVYGGMSLEDWKKLKAQIHENRECSEEDASFDRSLDRLARRIEKQISVAGELAPDLDWSFAQPGSPGDPLRPGWPGRDGRVPRGGPAGRPAPSSGAAAGATAVLPAPAPADQPVVQSSPDPADDDQTIAQLEANLSEQVELMSVMQDIADIQRRTYAMEQDRALSDSRGVFFGFLVSVAVIAAGWAPVVMATPEQRWWILGLTLVTCVIAGLVYVWISRRQKEKSTGE